AHEVPEAHACCHMCRVELERCAKLALGLFRARLLNERFAEKKVSGSGARLELERRTRELFGARGVALREVKLCERHQRLRRARLQAHAFFQLGDGARLVASCGEQPCELRSQSRIVAL